MRKRGWSDGTKISELVRRALAEYPQLGEYMGGGVINTRALAREILPEVRREYGREVKLQSVVTAIRRFPTSKGRIERGGLLRILSGSEVNLRYDMGALTVGLNPGILAKVKRLPALGGLIMIQGIETITVVAGEERLRDLEELFAGDVIEVKRGLASVVVKSPREITQTAGVIAHLASVLALERINVVEMMSSYTETCFVVAEEMALRCVEIIREEIKRARG